MSQLSIEELYVAYFGRAADPAGLNYWLSQEAAGTSDATIALQFVPQLETLGLYPLLNTPTLLSGSAAQQATFINAVYQNLFGHAADTAGLSYWQGQLINGASPGFMINQIIVGALGIDATTIANRAAVAGAYTNAVASAVPVVTWNPTNDTPQSRAVIASITATVTAANAAIAADIALDQSGSNGSGVTLTLTSGGQTISPASTVAGTQTTAGNDTIRGVLGGLPPGGATGSQLATNDSINGGGGVNMLNAVLDNEAAVTPVLTNMQFVNLAPSVNSQTFNASASTGITILSLAGAIFGPGDGEVITSMAFINIPTSVAVGMMNATGNFDSLSVSFTGLAASGNSATLVLNNNNGGGTFDTTNSAGIGVNTYNIQSNGTMLNVVTIGVNDTALSAMNIGGSNQIYLNNTSTGVTAINGSAATGNLTIITGALTGNATIVGGGGDDTLNATAATRAVTMSDGAGHDTLVFNGSVAGNSITAGSGMSWVQTAAGGVGLAFISAADTTSNSQLTTDVNQLSEYTAGATTVDLAGFSGVGGLIDTGLTATQLATASASATLLNAVNTVAQLVKAQALGQPLAVAFAYGGNEYIYQDESSASTIRQGDGLLQIIGAGATFRPTDLTIA
jgi:hypothetical protein